VSRCRKLVKRIQSNTGGGSVVLWGCFGNNQVKDLVKIDEILLKEGYKIK
jgi:hypothetical protein